MFVLTLIIRMRRNNEVFEFIENQNYTFIDYSFSHKNKKKYSIKFRDVIILKDFTQSMILPVLYDREYDCAIYLKFF
jgi:hypothetical protein